MTTGKRMALLAAVVVIAVVGFIVLKPDDKKKDTAATTAATTPAKPKTTQVTVKNGKPVGGIKKITVSKGDQVQFTVQSDLADEIHVHGYDFMKDVKAGGSVRFDFPAKIDGVFEIELENRGEQIAELEVQP